MGEAAASSPHPALRPRFLGLRLLVVGGISDFGTAMSLRVNSFIFSKADSSGLVAGALGVSVMASSFCRVASSACSVGHVVAGAMFAPMRES